MQFVKTNALLLALVAIVLFLPRIQGYPDLLDENRALREHVSDLDQRITEVDQLLLKLRRQDAQLGNLEPEGPHGPEPGAPTGGSIRGSRAGGGVLTREPADSWHLLDPCDHCRDVVVATALARVIDHAPRGLLRWVLPQVVRDVIELEVVAQAIRAEQEAIASSDGTHLDIDLDVLLVAERPGDDVPHLVMLGLLHRDQASLDLLVHERVILGQLLRTPVAHQVDATVTDVRDVGIRTIDHETDRRGPHPVELAVLTRLLEDALSGQANRVSHPLASKLDRVVVLDAEVSLELHVGDDLFDGAHRDRRGVLPACMAAHPVGYDEEIQLFIHKVIVLVVTPLQANVSHSARRDAHLALPLHQQA